jgi:hypothetical protein
MPRERRVIRKVIGGIFDGPPKQSRCKQSVRNDGGIEVRFHVAGLAHWAAAKCDRSAQLQGFGDPLGVKGFADHAGSVRLPTC